MLLEVATVCRDLGRGSTSVDSAESRLHGIFRSGVDHSRLEQTLPNAARKTFVLSQDDYWYRLQFQTSHPADDRAHRQASDLLEPHILEQYFDPPLLRDVDLIEDADFFTKRTVRVRSLVLYKQQKFNLLREELEGFSKLLVEVDNFLAALTPAPHDPTQVSALSDMVQAIIGVFDLDPNKVIDVLLSIASEYVEAQSAFLLDFLAQSPWFRTSESANRHSVEPRPTSHILGSRIRAELQTGSDPDRCMTLVALLISRRLVDIVELWPHIEPSLDALKVENDRYREELAMAMRQAKGSNALTMAAPLPDEDTPTIADGAGASGNNLGLDTGRDGKQAPVEGTWIAAIALLSSNLLRAGDQRSALFILSQCPGLVASRSCIADACNWAIEQAVTLFSTSCGLTNGSLLSSGVSAKDKLRCRPLDIRYRDSELGEPRPRTRDHGLRSPTSALAWAAEGRQSNSLKHKNSGALFDAVSPILRVVGASINRSPQAMLLLCTIAKQGLQQCSDGERPVLLDKWSQVIRHNLLPAVSLMAPNPAIIAQVFALIKEYDQERRFGFYGEWQSVSYKTIPELRVQAVKSERSTKDILKRISKTNAKDFGRMLAKSSHTNPCIVLTIALNQIESYDNLVEVVIEASRYFTMLTFDVMSFVLIALLSTDGKEKLKADKTSIAHWLQSLSAFTAKIFRRYSHLDPAPILTLLAKQLLRRRSLDMIIFEDLLQEMAGVGLGNDLSDDQLEGCTGGPALRSAALSLVNARQLDSSKSAGRLLQALERSRLVLPLLVLVARQSHAVSFVMPDTEAHLKLLSNLSDHCRQTFSQYLEVLTTFQSAESFAATLPAIGTFLRDYSLDLVTTFAVLRPVVTVLVHASWLNLKPSGLIEDRFAGIFGRSIESDPVQRIAVALSDASTLPSIIRPSLAAVFWSLSLGELICPTKRYEREIMRATGNENGGDSSELVNSLRRELSCQRQVSERCLALFESHAATWLAAADPGAWSRAFLQYCLIPRILFAPNDASYGAAFLRYLHRAAPVAMPLYELSTRLLGESLASVVFACTEREATHLGRFLAEWLDYLERLGQQDEAEFAVLPVRKPAGSSAHGPSLSRAQYLEAWYGWHRSLWRVVKACYDSKEYMHIRNCLFVLERVHKVFPRFTWMGKNITTANNKAAATETREDLRVRALGYSAMLTRMEATWEEPPLQRQTTPPAAESVSAPAAVERSPVDASLHTLPDRPISTRTSENQMDQNFSQRLPRGPGQRPVTSNPGVTKRNIGDGGGEQADTKPHVDHSVLPSPSQHTSEVPSQATNRHVSRQNLSPEANEAGPPNPRAKDRARGDRQDTHGRDLDGPEQGGPPKGAVRARNRQQSSTGTNEAFGRLRRDDLDRGRRSISKETRSGTGEALHSLGTAPETDRSRPTKPVTSQAGSERRRTDAGRSIRGAVRSPLRSSKADDSSGQQARAMPQEIDRAPRTERDLLPRGPGSSNNVDRMTRPRGPSAVAPTESALLAREREHDRRSQGLDASERDRPKAPRDATSQSQSQSRPLLRPSEPRNPQGTRARRSSPRRNSPTRESNYRRKAVRSPGPDSSASLGRQRGTPRERSPVARGSRARPPDEDEASRPKRRRQ